MAHNQPAGTRKGVTGLVLAGGRSRRFGSDKSTFRIEGVEMRVRVGRTLSEVTSEVFLSTNDATPQLETSTVRGPIAEWPFVASVKDKIPGMGPLSGIHAGMCVCTTDILLVAPCDMPDVTAATLRSFVDAILSSDAEAVIGEHDGRLIGVLGCYRTRLRDRVAGFLQNPQTTSSVEAFVRSLRRWHRVSVGRTEIRNVNRPADTE
jgi:molybdopterin-guanine dinucleotide biosynthesis protein A